MKNILVTSLAFIVFTASVTGQANSARKSKLEAQIIALDKLAWQAWKDKNAEWFKKHTTPDFLSINSEGMSNKADVIKATPAECDIKSFSLEDFKFMMLDEQTVVLIYIAHQDGVCGGKKIAPKVRAAVTYVKRNGNWLEALYIETPVSE